MKKILMLAAAVVAMTGISSATTFTQVTTCQSTILLGASTSGTGSTVCAGATGISGFALLGTKLEFQLDYTGTSFGAAVTSITESFSVASGPSSPVFSGDVNYYRVLSTGWSPFTGQGSAPTAAALTLTGTGPFTINTSASYITTAGSVNGASLNFAVVYSYDVPPSGVPEPSTVALIGAGLVGVASIARRRRS